MSRIGKLPITLPKGVEVKLGQDIVEVKGPKGSLTTPLCDLLDYEVTADHVTVTRKDLEDRATAQQHGLRRTLLANCVEGVTKGFSKTMEVIGVGFKVAVKGNIVECVQKFVACVNLNLTKAKVLSTKMKLFAAKLVSPALRANRGYRYDAF